MFRKKNLYTVLDIVDSGFRQVQIGLTVELWVECAIDFSTKRERVEIDEKRISVFDPIHQSKENYQHILLVHLPRGG